MNKLTMFFVVVLLIMSLLSCKTNDMLVSVSEQDAGENQSELINDNKIINAASLDENIADERIKQGVLILEYPVEMANSGEITLKSGETVYVLLELTNGVYTENDAMDNNYKGDYILSVYSRPYQSGNSLLYSVPIETYGYSKYFDLIVDDYNNDENPDFAIRVGRSSYMLTRYRVYTVSDNYTIQELPFMESDERYGVEIMARRLPSIRLIKEEEYIALYSMFSDAEKGGTPLLRNRYKFENNRFVCVENMVLFEDWDEENKRAYFHEKLDSQEQ